MIHFNVVLTVFHIDHISQGVCKTVGTTFWCIIVLQSRGEGPEKEHNYGTDSRQIFRTFSPQLENNYKLKIFNKSRCSTEFLNPGGLVWVWQTGRQVLTFQSGHPCVKCKLCQAQLNTNKQCFQTSIISQDIVELEKLDWTLVFCISRKRETLATDQQQRGSVLSAGNQTGASMNPHKNSNHTTPGIDLGLGYTVGKRLCLVLQFRRRFLAC